MTPAIEDLTLLISHQDQVTRLPENATLIASSEFCQYAAYHIDDQVLCFQGHPSSFTIIHGRCLICVSSTWAMRSIGKGWPACPASTRVKPWPNG